MVRIEDIGETENITFTLNDSHTACWQRAIDAGIDCGGDGKGRVVLRQSSRTGKAGTATNFHHMHKARCGELAQDPLTGCVSGSTATTLAQAQATRRLLVQLVPIEMDLVLADLCEAPEE